MIKEFDDYEPSEELLTRIAPWLTGIFEAGGSIYFESGDKGNYTSPVISYYAENRTEVELLRQMLGGTIKMERQDQGYSWRVRGTLALTLAAAMDKYASSFLKEYLIAIENWGQSGKEERLVISEALRHFNQNRQYPTPSEYKKKVNRADFVAGVFDSRGGVYFRETADADRNSYYGQPIGVISSSNRSLLEALNSKFGGHIALNSPAGAEYLIKTRGRVKEGITKRDSYMYQFGGRTAMPLFSYIQPFVLFKKSQIDGILQRR